MLKNIVFIITILMFSSCISYNEFGTYRVSKSKYNLSPNTNNNVYSVIDTNSIYTFKYEKRNNVSGSTIPYFYKFYANGKVGIFYIATLDMKKDLILDSKKGFMGFYNFDGKNITTQFYNHNWHGNYLETDTLSIKNDTIVKTYKNLKPEFAEIKSFFVKEKISNNAKITKPDW